MSAATDLGITVESLPGMATLDGAPICAVCSEATPTVVVIGSTRAEGRAGLAHGERYVEIALHGLDTSGYGAQ